MNIENEKSQIEICLKMIEHKLQWGNSTNWRNKEFEDLNKEIYEATQQQISISTLKRIWGKVKYEGAPNHYTLNVLALFLGFEDWRQFRYHLLDSTSESNIQESDTTMIDYSSSKLSETNILEDEDSYNADTVIEKENIDVKSDKKSTILPSNSSTPWLRYVLAVLVLIVVLGLGIYFVKEQKNQLYLLFLSLRHLMLV
jgi:hypothetical protein